MRTLLTIAAALAIVAAAPAQGYTSQDSDTIHSGPWMLRKSTGDKLNDKFWFIADRTLNAAEAETVRTMLNRMPGDTSSVLKKAVVNAIDSTASTNADYGRWSSSWSATPHMSDLDVYNAMQHGLGWHEVGVLYDWEAHAWDSQMDAIAKLVREGGWANSMWTTSPLNTNG
jgi:hypothetical protein